MFVGHFWFPEQHLGTAALMDITHRNIKGRMLKLLKYLASLGLGNWLFGQLFPCFAKMGHQRKKAKMCVISVSVTF